MKTIYLIIVLLFCFGANAFISPNKLDDWFEPFNTAIKRLDESNFMESKFSEAEFTYLAKKAWTSITGKKNNWIELLDPGQDVMGLQNLRHEFFKKRYISHVFTTKAGTLVFKMKKYPDIIIKIDNRPKEFLGANDYNYLAAYKKTALAQSQFMFRNLYLPLEVGAKTKSNESDNSQEIILKGVLAEKIPLFSTAEIDHRILLHLLIEEATINKNLKDKLKIVYKEMIHYICKVDFDDINYTNVPFAIDARLAPFDTDSQTARTGVINFLKLFFGYKILSLEEVTTAVDLSCSAPHKPTQARIEELYNDHEAQDEFFANNKVVIAGITKFMHNKTINFLSTLIHDENRNYAKIIDAALEEKFDKKDVNMSIFGQRCEHVGDFVYRIAVKINKKYRSLTIQEAENKVRKILNEQGKDYKFVYSYGPIDHRLGNLKDLRSFICF